MKSFAILAFLFIGTVTAFHVNEKWHARYVAAVSDEINQCSKEQNVNPDIAVKYTTDDSIDKKQVGCLYSCVFKKLGVMTDNGFVKEKAFEMVDKVQTENAAETEKVKKTAVNCATTVSTMDDPCMKSLKYVECFYADDQ